MIALGASIVPTIALLAFPFVAGGIAYAVASAVGLPPGSCFFWAIVVFAAALLIVLGVFLVKWLRRKMKAGKLEEGLAKGSGRYDQKGEIDALRKSWKESAGKLKGTAVGGGGSRALALLPWYVIIGAPASGKSTLLRQSGIDFPVGDAAIKGLQGTRNCDWWFSNVGVFLDTAGRYMSDEHADEWAQFLDLVRRHRTSAPINGVIVAVPAQDLLERSVAEQELEARRIRARLDELIDHLGVNFPVWVVLTKVDLVGGFVEFFGNADVATRQQMMGWTVDQDEGARYDGTVFDRRWADMIRRLRELRPQMVAAAKLRDRPAAYGFPDEMGVLAEPLAQLMQRLFEPNVYQETPLYRGLYITSATQQGTPLQRAAARVRHLLGAPAVDADAQGVLIKNAYFVKDLMRERIVADHGMTWTTQHEIDRGKMKRVGLNLIGSSVGVFCFLAVLAAGTCARHDLEAVAASLKESKTKDVSVVARCEELAAQRQKATFGVSKNLGLSLPLPLKKELTDREREIYRKEILSAVFAAHVAAIESAPTKGSGGVSALIASYRDYQATAAALRAVADRLKTPRADEKEPAEAKPKEGAAPADPDQPPADLLTAEQTAALLARHDDLVAAGILPKSGADEPARQIERLLAVAWRNGGLDDEASSAMSKAEEAFDRGLAAHFQQVADALRSRKAQAEQKRDSLARRKAAFLAECANAERLLQGVNPAEGTLRKEMELVAASLAADAGSPSAPAGSADLSVLGSVDTSVKALAAAKVRTDEQLAAVPGYKEAKSYADAEAALAKSPAAAPGDDAERLLTSLESVSNAVNEVLRQGPTSAAERRPWQAAPTMSDAVRALETAFKAKQETWAASVSGQLRPLLDPAASGDEALRRHAVVRLGEALLIDRMLREFVEDSEGGFDAFAKRIETRKRTLPGIPELDGDLSQLSAPMALAASWPFVSAEVVASIEDRVKASFKKVADAAKRQWDEKIRADTSDTGDWRACLDAWADADAVRGPAQLAALLDEKWGPARESRFDDASKSDQLSSDIWREALDASRANYRAFAGGVGVARKGAEALRKCVNMDITDLTLGDIAAKLGRSGNDPAWRQSGVLRAIPAGAPFSDAAAALKSALSAGEDDLVQRIAAWFNNKWSIERQRIEAAIKSPSPESQDVAREAIERMRVPMTAFFGAGMTDTPGTRLSVAGDYVGRMAEVTGKFAAPATEETSLAIECVAVPVSQSDKGFPQVEVEYKEVGKAPKSERWLPGEAKRLAFTFTPKKGEYFVIRMRNERTNAVKGFKEWTTPDCVVAAFAGALGSSSDSLDWEGDGEFRGDHAKFRLVSANSERIRALARGTQADSGARLPDKCVEVRK